VSFPKKLDPNFSLYDSTKYIYKNMLSISGINISVMDPKLFFSDLDPTFQEILDLDQISDPTLFISKDSKPKF
jgi:hypothetical protein